MKLIRYIFSLAIILGTMVAICMPADAGAYHYAGKRKKIYCGIVEIIDPQTGIVRNNTAIEQADNLFALLDALNDMKPAGWTLENPLALSQNKADPYYWRIPIASSRNLTRVNVLYFPGSGTIKLTADERENLRRFVDGGGVLWVDNANPSSPMHFDSAGLFFISKLDFKAGAVGFDGPVSRHHPLLTTPYWLTDVDIMSLGLGTGGSLSRSYCDMGTTALNQEPTSFDILFPIVDLSDQTGALAGKPSVVANAYGSGRVVATANAVGRGCLQPMPYNLPSLKFAFNIMAYGSTWTDLRKDPRHSGSSIDTIGSNPPVQKWWLPIAETGIRREASPLLYKNTVFYTSGDMLLALEQNADTKGGMWPAEPTGAVIVWDWKCEDGGVLSSPTIATVQHPDNNCQPIEAVMVQSSTGMVYVLNAFPIDANNVVMPGNVPFYQMETSSVDSSANSSGKGRWPSPPIYVNGWIYALGGNGRLYAENPCLNAWAAGHGGATIQNGQWSCPDVNSNPGWLTSPRCGPSYGSMRNANSGTVVGMVYWFTSPLKKENIELDETNDLVCSVPVSVSGERIRSLRFFDQTRTTARIDVTYKGLLSDVTVNIFQSDGVTPIRLARDPALNINENSVDTPGSIIVNTQVQIPRQYVAYVSYSLSYGSIGRKPTPGGGEIEPKSPKGTSSLVFPETIIEGTPVMGADNYLFLNGTRSMTPLSGGSILAYANDGGVGNVGMPTLGKLKWHYYLHSGVDNPNNTNVSIPGVIHTERGPMINPQPTSSPAVANGKVFVTVSSNNAPGDYSGPKAALLCLKSSADCVIRITESGGYDSNGRPIKRPKSLWRPNGAGNYNVRIWQPNLISEANYGIPMVDARDVSSGGVAATGVNVDYSTGTISFDDFSKAKVRPGGVDSNTFSPSLPVWVYLDNIEVPIDWNTWGPVKHLKDEGRSTPSDSVDLSGWNNLLWYYVVEDHECSGVHSPPTVIGNTVYFTCDDGYLYALDAETGESSGQKTSKKPLWTKKIGQEGTRIPEGEALSIAGANGVLMVPGPGGLFAFTDTTTLVTDNNRIVELDGQGEVTWAVDSIDWPANAPVSAGKNIALRQGPVNAPSCARYVATGEILFCNTGANQVCKIDKGGRVGFDGTGGQYISWVYSKFVDPKRLLRSGQPTRLSGPKDAIMWQEMEPVASGGVASVVHCLIADSGNSRILDLTYRVKNGQFVDSAGEEIGARFIDNDTGFVLPELNWVSKTDSLNERYVFDCIQLVSVPGTNTMVQDIWVASSNFTSAGTEIGGSGPKGKAGLGGAIMALRYRERSMEIGQAAEMWDYSTPLSGTITERCDRVSMNGVEVPLANPRYFDVVITPSQTPMGSPETSLLICDNYGVYEAIIGGPAPVVRDKLLSQDYANLLRLPDPAGKVDSACPNPPPNSNRFVPLPAAIPLQATCVQKLANGNWLITNSYSGSNIANTSKFTGETFEFNPQGPIDQEVTWCSPRLEWADLPPGADPCALPVDWKQTTSNTYNLRQPKSAFRK